MSKWILFLFSLSALGGEPITRSAEDCTYTLPLPTLQPPPQYPWEANKSGNHPKITKEHFRCRGSHSNPPLTFAKEGEGVVTYEDCGGSAKHSLPLRDQKEFVYPLLLELLNFIQEKTGKKVVVTSGHRCPEHNAYVDPSPDNQYSKHQIGAEVSFYVQGMEDQPEKIVELLLGFYKGASFNRYEKKDTNVSTPPWFNKEIFIKLFKKEEGRNVDNRHPYPYLSIQVRYDRDLKEPVAYSWPKANRNYHRH